LNFIQHPAKNIEYIVCPFEPRLSGLNGCVKHNDTVMRAIILDGFGGVENLQYADIPMPELGADDVLVQSKSISINPIDVKTRSGKGASGQFNDQMPVILGWDISGVIEAVGSGVSRFRPGDEVFGMLNFPKPGKTYAEYVIANPADLALKPANITHDEAAAATLAALTAWQTLTLYGQVKAGDRVLIHAAAGGVGHFAVQMARHFGAFVVATASAANEALVLSLGANEFINYRVTPFESVTRDIDFTLDTMGGAYIDRSLAVMKKGGTVVSIPSGLNEKVGEKSKALGMHGFATRVKPSGDDMLAIAGLLEKGIIRSYVSKTLPFYDMTEAHLQIESGRTTGKITLSF
jgi:NADPH:quinone reductase-like Zn-dependent oxidoreductase